MNSIIQALWHGNIVPQEDNGSPIEPRKRCAVP